MRFLLIFSIVTSSFFSHCHAQTDSTELLLSRIRSGAITFAERKKLKTIAFDVQNRGQLLDETNHDYAAALTLTDTAITMFNLLGDTLSEANNRKFKGYLLGRFNKFSEGKAEIQRAIYLYNLKNADWGVAVSQFDLSRLFEFENNLDSALFYCKIATSYWRAKGNSGRIFLNQNMLINLLTKLNRLDDAKLLQAESTTMAQDPEQHWQGLLDFYLVSEKLFKAAAEYNSAKSFQNLYTLKVSDLKKQGIKAISYFEAKK